VVHGFEEGESMEGHFNPDLKVRAFREMLPQDEGKDPLTMARIRFQRVCVFHPELSLSKKGRLAGLSLWEARRWWEMAYKGKEMP